MEAGESNPSDHGSCSLLFADTDFQQALILLSAFDHRTLPSPFRMGGPADVVWGTLHVFVFQGSSRLVHPSLFCPHVPFASNSLPGAAGRGRSSIS